VVQACSPSFLGGQVCRITQPRHSKAARST
jgi:hypothetical protein